MDHHYGRLLLLACFTDPATRQQIENQICSDINRLSVCECLKSYDLFFPGREYTLSQVKAILTENKVDGILIFQQLDRGSKSNYDPEESKTLGRAFLMGNKALGSNETDTGGVYNILGPWARFCITLLSLPENQITWNANAATTGNIIAKGANLIDNVSNETVKKLINDGLLQPKSNSR